MVVTNVRMPQSDYRLIKSIAGDLGMSVNEYIHFTATTNAQKYRAQPVNKLTTVYDALRKIIEKPTKYEPMGASEEDEAIYSI